MLCSLVSCFYNKSEDAYGWNENKFEYNTCNTFSQETLSGVILFWGGTETLTCPSKKKKKNKKEIIAFLMGHAKCQNLHSTPATNAENNLYRINSSNIWTFSWGMQIRCIFFFKWNSSFIAKILHHGCL